MCTCVIKQCQVFKSEDCGLFNYWRFICSLPHWVLPVDLWLLMGHEIHSWFWGNCIKHFLLQPKPQWSDFRWSRSPGGGTATKHVTGGAEVCWEVLWTPCKVNWSLVNIHVHSFRVITIESVVYNGVHVEWIMLNLYLVESAEFSRLMWHVAD